MSVEMTAEADVLSLGSDPFDTATPDRRPASRFD
jgi:hypothetical protein